MALGGSAARRYAEALLEIASSENAVPAFRVALDRLATALGPEVIRALRNPRVPLRQRRSALEAASKDEPKAVRSVLVLLLERDRIAILPQVARAYGDLVDRREGIVKAKITTAVELDSRQRDDLVRRLERAGRSKIRAAFTVDPTLIGGAKVQVGDRLIDSSLHTQLNALARQLAG